MGKEKKETTNSRIAVAIGFFTAFALQALMFATYHTLIPLMLPAVIFMGLICYFLREKILFALLGFGVGMAVILVGLFWWLIANGLID